MLLVLAVTMLPINITCAADTRRITYNPNGGTGSVTYTDEVYWGPYDIVDRNYTRVDHVFGGYNEKPDGSGDKYTPGQRIRVEVNLTLYAQWIPLVTITYNANSGSGMQTSVTIEKSKSLEITSMGYTKKDYTLTGFNTHTEGKGTQYDVGKSYTFSANTTIYAQWKNNTVTVTYNPNGGIGQASDPAISGTYYTVRDKGFTRSGYTLDNYNTQADGKGTQRIIGTSFAVSGNVTLYAQWISNTITVKYDPNNGNGKTYDISVTKNSALTVATQDYTRYGYNFTGYNTKKDGSGTPYAFGQSLPTSSDITLYAQWVEKAKYAVTYNPNYPDGEPGQTYIVSEYVGEKHTVLDRNYSWEGYKFLNYNTMPDGSGITYARGNIFTVSAGVTLYAQWTAKIAHTITYNPNYPKGGVGKETISNVYGGDDYQVENLEYTRPGYTFTGKYNTNKDGTGTTYQKNQQITITESMVLYAQWEKVGAANDDTLKAVVTKLLKVPLGTSVPTMSFSFEAERLTEDDKPPSDDMPDITISDTNFSEHMSEGEYAYTDRIGIFDYFYLESNDFLNDIIWPYPGIFKYMITETVSGYTDGNTTMYYSKAEYILTAVVSNADIKPANGILDIMQISVVLNKDDNGKELGGNERLKVDPKPGGDSDEYFTGRMIFTNEFREKLVAFDPTNPYHWKLSVSNNVTGRTSDQSHYFEYNMTITDPAGAPSGNTDPAGSYIAYVVEIATNDPNVTFDPTAVFDPTATYRISADPQANLADSEGKIRFASGENKTFYLKHGQHLVFLDLPAETKYMVAASKNVSWLPSAYVTNDGISQGVEPRNESTDLTIPEISNSTFNAPLFIGDETHSVNFVNTRDEYIGTGLDQNSLPFIGIIAMALASLAAWVYIKPLTRRR